MTATVVLSNPQCGIMLGAKGFHSGRELDWVPSSTSQPAWVNTRKGESPVSFSFPVQAGQKGYIMVAGPYLDEGGGFSMNNWVAAACNKGGDYNLVPTANEMPRGVPAVASDGRRILPPMQYRLVVTYAGEGPATATANPFSTAQPGQATVLAPPPAADSLAQEITLAPGATRELTLAATRILEIQARIACAKVAGGNYGLDLSVNGQRLSSRLLNKGPDFQLADGRSMPYYDDNAGAPGWLVFYSPRLQREQHAGRGRLPGHYQSGAGVSLPVGYLFAGGRGADNPPRPAQ